MRYIIIFFLFVFYSCNKDGVDPCLNNQCLNGGNCNDGTCDCPPGYAGTRCEIQLQDPCDGIVCLNGGTCINGNCNCPEGYSGPDCSIEETPVSVTISKIVVTKFPTEDSNGIGWDINSAPDIIASLNPGTSPVLTSYTSDYATDVIPPHQFSGSAHNLPYTITSPGSIWTFAVWDYDSMIDWTLMEADQFYPNDYKSGFPETVTLGTDSDKLQMILSVKWNF